MTCSGERKIILDDTTATVVEFDPAELEEQIDNGDVILLLSINVNGEIKVYQSAKNPFADAPPTMERGASFFANASISSTFCGCHNGRKYYRFGNICCRSSEKC